MAETGALQRALTLADSEVSNRIPQNVSLDMAPKKRSKAQLAAAERGTSMTKNKAAKKQHVDTRTTNDAEAHGVLSCTKLRRVSHMLVRLGWESSGTIARRLPLRAAGSLNNGNREADDVPHRGVQHQRFPRALSGAIKASYAGRPSVRTVSAATRSSIARATCKAQWQKDFWRLLLACVVVPRFRISGNDSRPLGRGVHMMKHECV